MVDTSTSSQSLKLNSVNLAALRRNVTMQIPLKIQAV